MPLPFKRRTLLASAAVLGAGALPASAQTPKRREFGQLAPVRADWIARQPVEPILEPELPIVDTHFHFLDVPGFQYLAKDLLADLDTGHRVEATVFAEARTRYRTDGPPALRPVGEVEFVVTQAQAVPTGPYAQGRIATGIVGFADLLLGAKVEEVLAAQIEAGQGRFKGIRHGTAFDESSVIVAHNNAQRGTMDRGEFHAGARVLAKMGLSFDAWAFFHQLDEVARLADAVPDLKIVVGHAGGALGYGPYAGRHAEVFAEWGRQMSALAKRPNVSVKLGGTLLRLATHDYLNVEVPESSESLAAVMRPTIVGCIERFGAERCMFESNFPIEKTVTGYAQLWNAFKRITADASPSEKNALYSGTATRTYRLARR